MKITQGLKCLKRQKTKSVTTIGVFDGVHIGHKKILTEVVKQARAKKEKAVVVTFYPHPSRVLDRQFAKSSITSLEHRLKILEAIGIDLCVLIKFTAAFSRKPIKQFIEHIVAGKLNTRLLIVGSKFRLGAKKNPPSKLKNILKKHGIEFRVIKIERIKNKAVSSSIIRNFIESGKLKLASEFLGRKVAVFGRVKRGRGIGKSIGFKTANIDPHHEVMPPAGVYAVKVKANEKIYNGVLNIGFRPTIGIRQKEPEIETHILGFKGNLYGKNIEIYFIKKIRQEKRFKSRETLRRQIERDIEAIKTP